MANNPKPALGFFTGADLNVNTPDDEGKVNGLKQAAPEAAPAEESAAKPAAKKPAANK